MITTLLVANRGEIARRIFRTCRALGIGTVAVHTDDTADDPFVAEADAAVRLPGAAPADTYLRADLIVAAAGTAGADAVHPGYGFLSENAGFARAVIEAGLTWVGPDPGAIEQMGAKIGAKALMERAGVPVLPELRPRDIAEPDLPVLVKASAGGGGRGMRVVRSLAELPGEVEAARSEALSAFGDPAVFCEPYVRAGRHIEVQILADTRGTVWALGERDCSIQRRHQKIIEETPAPGIGEPTRRALHEAAVLAARSIGYVGAGTVEFLLAPDGSFAFLEMNTRLQVEHPVTECVTGLDLVEWQLRIAEGAALEGGPPAPRGHAVEARLYAEDPARDWRPHSGTVLRFEVPAAIARFEAPGRSGVRLDSGVEDGARVSVHHDPMLAKAVAWAPTRGDAVRRLAAALAGSRIHGVVTNRDLLVRLLDHPAFGRGEVHTGFLAEHGLDALARPLADPGARRLSALAAALADAAGNRRGARVLGGLPSGWRNLASQPQRKAYRAPDGEKIEVGYLFTRSGLRAEGHDGVELVRADPERVVLVADGVRRTFDVAAYTDMTCVDSPLGPVALVPVGRFSDPSAQVAPGTLLAPMPGTVSRLAVGPGARVARGQPLMWLEAMKMEHRITAPADGVVADLPAAVGLRVESGSVLAVVTEEEST